MNSKLDLKAIDVEAIAAAIEDDAGEPIPGLREGLAELKMSKVGRIHTSEEILVRAARRKLGLSQESFAACLGTPLHTLRGWEQGRFTPPGSATTLARLLIKHPDLVNELVAI